MIKSSINLNWDGAILYLHIYVLKWSHKVSESIDIMEKENLMIRLWNNDNIARKVTDFMRPQNQTVYSG